MVVGVVAFLAGGVSDRGLVEYERRQTERGPYKIKVHETYDTRHALVQKIDDNGTPLSSTWKLAICPYEPSPVFDVGCVYEVDFELANTKAGWCETFTGEHAKAKEINCP